VVARKGSYENERDAPRERPSWRGFKGSRVALLLEIRI